jgi:hypothetical protein
LLQSIVKYWFREFGHKKGETREVAAFLKNMAEIVRTKEENIGNMRLI